jgi:gluconolactonase
MEQSKRDFLKAGAGVAAVAAMPALAQTPAGWQPSGRYPDPTVKVVDPSFGRYKLGLAKVERIASNCRWNEGPVWFGDGRYLLWSDIPNNRIMRWDEESGVVSVFRRPSNNANGNRNPLCLIRRCGLERADPKRCRIWAIGLVLLVPMAPHEVGVPIA